MKNRLAPLALAAAFVFAAPALAQTGSKEQTPPATTQPGMGPGMGAGHGMGPGMMYGQGRGRGGCLGGMMGMGPGFGMMHYTDGTLAFLKAELKITGKQEKVWKNFADAMRANAGSMRASMTAMMAGGPPQTMPDRLSRHETMMAARLESLRNMKKAMLPLYDALDARQKQEMDVMMTPCRGMGWGAGADTGGDNED